MANGPIVQWPMVNVAGAHAFSVQVSPEMGPTEMCPGKKLRFYHGYRCQDHLRMATTAGTIAIFDYKTLHRGPANEHPTVGTDIFVVGQPGPSPLSWWQSPAPSCSPHSGGASEPLGQHWASARRL